jgi:hypothetical protein
MNMERLPKTLIIVAILDVIVLGIVVLLFKYLNSEASVEGADLGFGKWQAGGALAGFVIVMAVQLYIIQRFSPKGAEAHASYPAIMEFYNKLQEEDYTNAWNSISPEMQQKRWNGDVGRFENGFQNTQGINLLAVDFVSELSSYSHEYVVYYQDKTESPVLPGLEKLGEWDIRNLPVLNDKIGALRKLMVDKDIEVAALDDMKLAQMVTAIRGDILRWRVANSSGAKKADDLFPTSKAVSRLVGKRVTMGFHDKKWLIDHIEDIPYNEE